MDRYWALRLHNCPVESSRTIWKISCDCWISFSPVYLMQSLFTFIRHFRRFSGTYFNKLCLQFHCSNEYRYNMVTMKKTSEIALVTLHIVSKDNHIESET